MAKNLVAFVLFSLFLTIYSQNTCYPNPCVNGLCTQNGYSYTCTCSNGWSGLRCDIFIGNTVAPVTDPCFSHPCLFGGTCIKIPAANVVPPYACVCASGRTGLQCESFLITNPPNGCSSSPCNFGSCLPNALTGGYTCNQSLYRFKYI